MIRSHLLTGLAIAALAAVFAGCHTDSEPTPTVHFVSPAMNDTVGPDVFVKLAVTGFKFSAGAVEKTSAAQHEEADVTGHIHLFLDMPIGLDADAVEQLSKSDTVTLKGLKAGKHYLWAQGAETGHDDIDGMVDSVAFTVVVP
jgi:hypothetical protein